MPGIFGVLAKRPDLPPRELGHLGRRMADAMHAVPWLSSELWAAPGFCGGRVHLGVLHPAPQPVASGDGQVRLWLDGEAFGPDSLDSARLTPGEILPLVESPECLRRVDGAFNLAAFRPDGAELTLVTDRLGLRPLYFTETSEWLAYAAELKCLLAILPRQPDLDRTSLRQFLSADHLFGERTWWSGIELLPPGSHWRIDPQGKERRRYWSFADIERHPVDEEDAVEEFGALWSRSVGRRLKPGCSPYLLSGGQDSRMLLAEMRAQGAEATAFTFGTPGCADIEIARRCAGVLGVRHQALPMTPESWWHGREQAIWQTDGLVNAMHLHVAVAAPYLHSGNRCMQKHSGGGNLFGGSQLRYAFPEWRSEPHKLVANHLKESPFFSREEAVEAAVPDSRAYLVGPSSDCFTLMQRQRRMIMTGPFALGAHCEVATPAADLDMLQLCLGGLSDEQRAGGRFYRKALMRHYPTLFRDIPRNATGRAVEERLPLRITRGLRAGLAKRLNKLPVAWRVSKHVDVPHGKFHDYPAFLRHSDVVAAVTRGGLLVDEYLDGRALPYLERGWQSAQGSARAVLALLTVETYLRQVADLPWPER